MMKLLRDFEVQVFAVCLVLLLITCQDTEGASLCLSMPNTYETCYGINSYCCPSISYWLSYSGTTFKTCCPSKSYFSNTRYCTNIYAHLYCNAGAGTTHCCPSLTYMSGGLRRGCCDLSISSSSCQSVPSKAASACYGTSSYCCPYMSNYAQSSTFATCCGPSELVAPAKSCSNMYEYYWCRSPTSHCCDSRTYISGSLLSGCCSSTSSYSSSSNTTFFGGGNTTIIFGGGGGKTTIIRSTGFWNLNIGAIVGSAVGVFVLIVIIASIAGTCSSRARRRRNARRTRTQANRGNMGFVPGGVNQGYPQHYPQQSRPCPPRYPQQGYVIQGGYPELGAVNYHPAAPVPVRLPGNTATTVASAPAMPANSTLSSGGRAVGGNVQPGDSPPAYDNVAFSRY